MTANRRDPGWGGRTCWCKWCASRRAMQVRALPMTAMSDQFWYQFVHGHYSPVEVGFSVRVAEVGFPRRDP